MSLENNPQFIFIKLAIEKVKEYARQHKCPIYAACGAATGVSEQAYKDAVEFMISSGYRNLIYNKVQLSWDDLDIVRNFNIRSDYPHLYREITIPEISIREHNDQGCWYLLSDNAYNEWCKYIKNTPERDLQHEDYQKQYSL